MPSRSTTTASARKPWTNGRLIARPRASTSRSIWPMSPISIPVPETCKEDRGGSRPVEILVNNAGITRDAMFPR